MKLEEKIRQAKTQSEAPKSVATSKHDEIEIWLAERYDFRYNMVLASIEFKDRNAETWTRLTDRDTRTMLRHIRHDRIKATKQAIDELIDSDYSPCYHPFKEYFKRIGKGHEGSIKRLADTIELSNDEERPRFELMLTKWLVACVGCALYKEHINETMLIFVGGQGAGKTRWFKSLMPEELHDYFKKGLGSLDDKDSQVALSECFLILLDELVTLRKNDIEAIKSLTSESEVRVRRPYERRSEVLMRRANFAGNDNNEDIINDPTGSRRFLIFSIKAIDYQHNIDIDEVWSEANKLFHDGYEYWLDKGEQEELNTANNAYQIRSIEHELVAKYFEAGGDFFTSTDILRHINTEEGGDNGRHIALQSSQVTLRKIGGACKALGFERKAKKMNGKTVYGYECKASTLQGAVGGGDVPF